MDCRKLILMTLALIALITIVSVATDDGDSAGTTYIQILDTKVTTTEASDIFGEETVDFSFSNNIGTLTVWDMTFYADSAEMVSDNAIISTNYALIINLQGHCKIEMPAKVGGSYLASYGIYSASTVTINDNTTGDDAGSMTVLSEGQCINCTTLTINAATYLSSLTTAIQCTAEIQGGNAYIVGQTRASQYAITIGSDMITRASSSYPAVLGAYDSTHLSTYKVLAVDMNKIYINGVEMTAENHRVTNADGYADYDFDTKTLTLSDFNVGSGISHTSAITQNKGEVGIYSADDINITVMGDSSVASGIELYVLGYIKFVGTTDAELSLSYQVYSLSALEFRNISVSARNSLLAMGAMTFYDADVTVSNSGEITGIHAVGAIDITNGSTVSVSQCDEFSSDGNITISTSTVTLTSTEEFSGYDIVIQSSTVNATITGQGIDAANNLTLSGSTVTLDLQVGDSSISPIALNAANVLSIQSGTTTIEIDSEIDDLETVIAVMGRSVYLSQGAVADITVSTGSKRIGICADTLMNISVERMSEGSFDTTPALEINLGSSTGQSIGLISNSSDITLSGSICITNSSAGTVTGVQAETVTLGEYCYLEISIWGSSNPTKGIVASTKLQIDSAYTITINVIGSEGAEAVAYGIQTDEMTMTDGELVIKASSHGGSYGIKTTSAVSLTADKIKIDVGSDDGTITGIDTADTLTVTCGNFAVGIFNNNISDDVIGISADTAVIDATGNITLVSSGDCVGIQATTSLTMKGSGTFAITMTSLDGTGISVTNGDLILSETCTLNIEIIGPGTEITSSALGIDVSATMTVSGTVALRVKSRNASLNKGISVNDLTVTGGSIHVTCTDSAIRSVNAITAADYVSSHTNETFVSGTTTELTPKSSSTVKFALGAVITIVSNDTDYGTVSRSSMTVPTGSVIHVSGTTITIADFDSIATATESSTMYSYAFVGWSVSDGSTVTEAMTVTAEFSMTPQSYTIKFSLNGGTCPTEPSSDWTPVMSGTKIIAYEKVLEYGAEVVAIPSPEKFGYTFTGWSPTVSPTMPDCNTTYTAQFQINEHVMSIIISGVSTTAGYKINGGDTETYDPLNPPNIEYSSTITIIPTFVTGYTYKVYLDGEEMGIDYFVMPDNDVIVSITYTPNTHTATIYLNGGYYDSTPEGWTAVTGQSETIVGYVRNVDFNTLMTEVLPSSGPLKTGYRFTQWTAEGGVPQYMPDENVVLTATYDKMKYKVTVLIEGANGSVSYSINSGTVTQYTSPFDVYYGDSVHVTANPVYEYTSALSSDDVLITEGTFSMPDSSVTVYAVYTVNMHTLSVMLNGGSIASVSEEWTPITDEGTVIGYSREFGYDRTVSLPGTPVREGHSFSAWSPAAPSVMPAYDLTLTATYDVEQYLITMNITGASGSVKYTVDSGDATDYTAPFNAYYGQTISVIPSYLTHYHTSVYSDDVTVTDNTFTVPSKNVTVTVEYIIDSYTVTILLNSGHYDTDPDGWTRYIDEKGKFVGYQKDFGYDTAIVMPSDPLLTGHTFLGWDPAVPEKMPEYPLRFEARYTIAQYTVTIDSSIEGMKYKIDSGEEIVYTAPFSAGYGSYVSVIVPSKPGYTAKLSSSDTQVGDTIFKMPAHDVHASLNYEVSNNLVTISVTMPNAVIKYRIDGGEEKQYVNPFYLKAGQVLTMTSNRIDGYEAAVFSSEQVKITEGAFTMGDTPVTVAVSYLGSFYKLSLSMNGGHYDTDPEGWTPIKNTEGVTTGYSKEFRCGSLITLPGDPVKTGYTFAVWSPQPATMPAQDTNITAIYTVNLYTLKWFSENELYLSEQVSYGTTIVPPADPKKAATEQSTFEFKQWIGLTDGMKVSGDASFTAEFKTVAKTYTVNEGKKAVVTAETSSAAIPSVVIGKIQQDVQSKAVSTLTLTVLWGSMTIGSESITSLNDTVDLSIYQASESSVHEKLRQMVSGRPIYDITTNVSGSMTITLSYTPLSGEKTEGLFAVFLKDDGTYEKLDSSYADGKITFTTDHNSQYAILYEEPVVKEDNTLLYIGIAAGAIILAIVVIYFVRRIIKTRKF